MLVVLGFPSNRNYVWKMHLTKLISECVDYCIKPRSQNLNNNFYRRILNNFVLYIHQRLYTNGAVSYNLLTLNIRQLHYHHIIELNINFPQHISAIEYIIIILHCTNWIICNYFETNRTIYCSEWCTFFLSFYFL